MKHKGNILMLMGALLLGASLATAGIYLKEDRQGKAAAERSLQEVRYAIDNGTSDGYEPLKQRPDPDLRDDSTGGPESTGATGSGESADSTGSAEEMTAALLPEYRIADIPEMPEEVVNGIGYIGVVTIPAIDRELPVISQCTLPLLKTAPCRYYGSAYKDNMVLCGHSYVSHFRPIRQLKPGDEVFFEDVDGNRFEYTVGLTEILAPTDVERVTNDEWDLTLFTCTSDSASRFTVRCLRSDSDVKIKDI